MYFNKTIVLAKNKNILFKVMKYETSGNQVCTTLVNGEPVYLASGYQIPIQIMNRWANILMVKRES